MFRQLISMLTGVRFAKLTRVNVFKKLNHERLYQQSRWPTDVSSVAGEYGVCVTQLNDRDLPTEECYHEVGSWISLMNAYLRKAENAHAIADKQEALLIIRKVAALGVSCLEQHGCPDRPGWGPEEMEAHLIRKTQKVVEPPPPLFAKPGEPMLHPMFENKTAGRHHNTTGEIPLGGPLDQKEGDTAECNDPECIIHGKDGLLEMMAKKSS